MRFEDNEQYQHFLNHTFMLLISRFYPIDPHIDRPIPPCNTIQGPNLNDRLRLKLRSFHTQNRLPIALVHNQQQLKLQ